MSRPTSSGKHPGIGVPLPMRLLRKLGRLPQLPAVPQLPSRAMLSMLGIKDPASKYLEGFDWVFEDDGKDRVSVEVTMKNGKPTIAMVSATKKGTQKRTLARLHFPSQNYTCGIRFYREVFSIEIWVTPSDGSTPYVWGLFLTSSLHDGRMSEAKKVWAVLRSAFQRLSLEEVITDLDLPQAHNDALPTPSHPHNLRKTSLRRRQLVTGNEESWALEMDIPGRKPWVFTKHLANKALMDGVEKLMQGVPEIRQRKSRRKPKDAQKGLSTGNPSKRAAPMDELDVENLGPTKKNAKKAVPAGNPSGVAAPLGEMEAASPGPPKKKKKGTNAKLTPSAVVDDMPSNDERFRL